MRLLALLAWMVPLAMHSGDALAWGLYTHVYFAQLLIWAVPLADPAFRRAVRRFPDLLLAGACLPDTALLSRHARARALATTHQWRAAQGMISAACDDESRAIAAGYASHLFTDIIAHNYFVPAHESLWFDYPVVTHAACEWAMDAHVAPQLFAQPKDLLRRHCRRLACQAADYLGCPGEAARRALHWLGNGEHLLRATCIHRAVRRGAAALDRRTERRFDYYVSETARRLPQINRLLGGESPAWNAEPERNRGSGTCSPPFSARNVLHSLPLPRDLF